MKLFATFMFCPTLSVLTFIIFAHVPAPAFHSYHSEDIDFQNPLLNQVLSLISTLLSPVQARQDFLPDFSIDFKPTSDSDKGSLSPQSDDMWTGRIWNRNLHPSSL
jgi:hypothetical protein